MPIKKTLKEEISEKFMEKLLDMVNQDVQDTLKKFQDTKNKEHEMTQKQIKNSDRTSTNTKVKQSTL
jgi:5'-deoxynucleotidase YfbR-like HD superfamily hydrolase